MEALREALEALRRPQRAFAAPLEPDESQGRAFGRMLLWWLPPALLHGALSAWGAFEGYRALRMGHLPAWMGRLRLPGLDPDTMRFLLRGLPPPPGIALVAAAVLLLVPLGVVGVWLHDAVWDHTALWLLGGLKARRGFRATLLAESRALRIASLGAWAGLLGFLPWVGGLLEGPLLLLAGYLWLFRGFALAAAHGLPSWKGVLATVLHAALLALFAALLLGMMVWMLRAAG